MFTRYVDHIVPGFPGKKTIHHYPPISTAANRELAHLLATFLQLYNGVIKDQHRRGTNLCPSYPSLGRVVDFNGATRAFTIMDATLLSELKNVIALYAFICECVQLNFCMVKGCRSVSSINKDVI